MVFGEKRRFGDFAGCCRPLFRLKTAARAPAPFVLAPSDFSPKPDAFYAGADADPEASAALLHDSHQRTPYAAVPGSEGKADARDAALDPAAARARTRVTRLCTVLGLLSLGPVVLGIVVGYLYVDAETDESKVEKPRAPGGMTGGVEFEAIGYFVSEVGCWQRSMAYRV